MSDTITPVDPIDVFTTAVRAVLAEIEYDGHLPIPMRICPTGTGVELQVREDEFPAWSETLAGCQTEITAEAHYAEHLGLIEHVTATGTINNHCVRVIAVRKVHTGQAVA